MKTYILDIIPKIQKFSQRLDDLTVLLDKHWVFLDEENLSKSVFIFRKKNNQLLISENGVIEKGNWEYLGNNSILIERNNGTFLYRHGFIDEYVLALKIDEKDEYVLLINDEWFEKQLRTIGKILKFLNEKYIEGKEHYDISIPKHLIHNLPKPEKAKIKELKNNTILNYKITKEEKGWSLMTGKYIEFFISFENHTGTVLYVSKKDKFCFIKSDSSEYFDDLESCILRYKEYLEKK
jgi:hypothetical protein